MRHFHLALANPDGMLAQHAIYLREPPPVTVDQATAGGFVSECDHALCFAMQFTSSAMDDAVHLIMQAQAPKVDLGRLRR